MIRLEPKPAPQAKPAASCTRIAIHQLADCIREMGYAGQDMTSAALAERGFSERFILKHGPAARALARRQSVRRIQ
jgi:hypothetical protein